MVAEAEAETETDFKKTKRPYESRLLHYLRFIIEQTNPEAFRSNFEFMIHSNVTAIQTSPSTSRPQSPRASARRAPKKAVFKLQTPIAYIVEPVSEPLTFISTSY
jgi:hypothetical protein